MEKAPVIVVKAGGAKGINNDAVCEPELTSKLLAVVAEHPEVGLVGPRICRHDRPARIETDGFSGWLPVVLPMPRGAGFSPN